MAVELPLSGGKPEIDPLALQAADLAGELLARAHRHQTRAERAQREKMKRMMDDPDGKVFTIAMADRVLRIRQSRRAAESLRRLVQRLGLPAYLDTWERWLLRTATLASAAVPGIVVPQVGRRIRQESRHVILPAEKRALHHYLDRRRHSGIRVNLNLLGEAVLGEREAARRLEANLEQLADPRVDYISVKISSIFSQIHLPAYETSLRVIQERLRKLYRAAIEHGSGTPKFVNLDMEEYRDLDLTVDAFMTVLDEPEFLHLEAGIVLQAYLPDAFAVQQHLTTWARERFQKGGARIKMRLVKGANLAMEQVEAALREWPQAPYSRKHEVDANFKRMLHHGCRPENAAAVRLGVASHNLFDIAYAILLREARDVEKDVEFEMLEGMANAQARAVRNHAGDLLVYAPIVRREHFESAIAYLVRRLDENTAPQNFLCDLFGLEKDSPAWRRQRDRFLEACQAANSPALADRPRRTQNRLTEVHTPAPPGTPFANAPDTDFALAANRKWAREITARAGELSQDHPIKPLDDEAAIEEALNRAVTAQRGWEAVGIAGRAEILQRAAAVIAGQRGDSIALMMAEARKALTEADTEVSEAVDFARYYAGSFDEPGWLDGTQPEALGVILVTPPWNFPYAIPAGGCLAALMAGNAVLLKPAPETPRLARFLVRQLHEAGVPEDVLQFLPVPDGDAGQKLVTDHRVAAVILTGSMETARLFRRWKPDLRLYAETSGKNSLVITAAADLDLAVKDLVRSAFFHAGQKCSAASLALVEASVYDDPAFRRQLKDAAESLPAGSATDPASAVTPLIRPPGEDLLRALTTLDAGETWLLKPENPDGESTLWTPGIKLGVQAGSWFHRTECFGPVLGLIRVDDLEEAIAVQNDSAFGLTGGLHSLDTLEIARWREAVEVGNVYVNRGTTGAIVRRQPFGGWKNSVAGPGAKAGGPNYVASFCRWRETSPPSGFPPGKDPGCHEADDLLRAADLLDLAGTPEGLEAARVSALSYLYWWHREFAGEHDPSEVLGESNHFRYRCRRGLIVRIQQPANLLAVLRVLLACRITGVDFTVSADAPVPGLPSDCEVILEDETALASRLSEASWSALRLLGRAGADLHQGVAASNTTLLDAEPVSNGRVELRHYLLEQTVSQTTHRYGNVTGGEQR